MPGLAIIIGVFILFFLRFTPSSKSATQNASTFNSSKISAILTSPFPYANAFKTAIIFVDFFNFFLKKERFAMIAFFSI